MKKTLLAALTLAALTLGLRAEEPAPSYSVSTDFTYTTRYYFRGVQQQQSAFQPSVAFAKGGLSLGAWSSYALEEKSTAWSRGEEIDLFGSYSVALAEGYTGTAGLTYYAYPSARSASSEPDSTYESFVSVAGPLGPLSGKVTFFHDFVYDSNTFQFDLGYSKPFADGAAQLDFGCYYGLNDIGDGDGDLPGTGGYDYKYYGADVSLSGKLSETATLKIGAHWTNTSDLAQPSPKLWLTVGLTLAL